MAVCAVGLLAFSGCKRGSGRVLEVAYVSGVQVNLRDRVAAVYEKAGLVKNGDRVEVLDRDRRFAKVRTASGQTGWMEQRYLVGQQVFDQLQRLTVENANDPIQTQGVTRNDTNLHVEPGRDTEHLYQISAGEKLAVLKRATAEKPGAVAVARPTTAKTTEATGAAAPTPRPVLEDWWLVRDTHARVGWVLGRMVDVDVPMDIAQYAEGQRIVAFFALNQVQDEGKSVPQYVTFLTEPKDGLPFDFNQFRVFTWNIRKHRYETAYRERTEGMLPVTISQENFDKEGMLPVFTIRVRDESGNISERKYKLNTPMVRRVYAPGEEPSHSATKRVGPRRAGSTKRGRRH